ncbi:hypothetical protein VTK56DRAFT_4124 [Thermocarpiscus australiensis]
MVTSGSIPHRRPESRGRRSGPTVPLSLSQPSKTPSSTILQISPMAGVWRYLSSNTYISTETMARYRHADASPLISSSSYVLGKGRKGGSKGLPACTDDRRAVEEQCQVTMQKPASNSLVCCYAGLGSRCSTATSSGYSATARCITSIASRNTTK